MFILTILYYICDSEKEKEREERKRKREMRNIQGAESARVQ